MAKPTDQLIRDAINRARLREVIEATETPSERLHDTIQRIGHNLNELRSCLPDPDDDPLLPLIQRMEELVLDAINIIDAARDSK